MSKSRMGRDAKRPSRRLQKRRKANQDPAPVEADRTQSLIGSALRLQQSGDLKQAENLYRQALEREPGNPDAWHLLGMTLFSSSQFDAAIECLQEAITIVENHPDILANLGVVYRSAGRLCDARIVLEKAVQLNPQSAATQTNLGTVCLESGDLDTAEAHFKKALAVDSNFAQAAMNLANLWQQQGKFLDSEKLYRDLLGRCPDNSSLLNNLGEALRHQGKREAAIEVGRRALQLAPDNVEFRINLGRSLANDGYVDEARLHFEKLIQLRPQLAKPYHYLGKLQLAQRDLASAVPHLEKAVELEPSDVFALHSLGFAYLEMGRAQDAESCFRAVIEKDPAMSQAHGSLLFLMSGNAELDPQELFEEHKKWGNTHGNVEPLSSKSQCVSVVDRRLRIGYVSPDFRKHAVASYISPVLKSHRREQVEVFCYAEVIVPDETTEQLKHLSDHWRFTNGLSDEQVAQMIEADQIDILVDLAGHTGHNRLRVFAYRPAPVQVTWLGYPNTTGLESIDYRLTCEVQNPRDEESFHTEQLFHMPRGSFCFSRPNNAPTVGVLPANQNGFVTFGSLHRPDKISEVARDLWAQVLLACPDSRMLVFNTRFTNESTEELLSALSRRGVKRERVSVCNQINDESYLENYHEIDVALDVTPWAGGTTTLESLWMGVPVVALYGGRRSSRSTAAIMKNVGYEELIAYSTDQYVELAVQLSGDLNRLVELRQNLRQRTEATVVDSIGFTQDLEEAYRHMWRRWCEHGSD